MSIYNLTPENTDITKIIDIKFRDIQRNLQGNLHALQRTIEQLMQNS